jgi:hypothetical protein
MRFIKLTVLGGTLLVFLGVGCNSSDNTEGKEPGKGVPNPQSKQTGGKGMPTPPPPPNPPD